MGNYVDDHIEALKELVLEKFRASDEALRLQAAIYNKHLEALNNENIRITNIQNSCVSKELYEAHHKIVEDDVKELQSFRDNLQGRLAVTAILASVISSVLVGLIVGIVIWTITGR
jgi:hypothetical protein